MKTESRPSEPQKMSTSKPSPTYKMRSTFFSRKLDRIFDKVNRKKEWHELWRWFGLLNLAAIRDQLREHNLHDTSQIGSPQPPTLPPLDPVAKFFRSYDGTYNDLETAGMGMTGARFGRNFPLAEVVPDKENLLTPNPRDISQQLLKRDRFVPATSLNLLAAAWIQFQTHDWFSHHVDTESDKIKIPVADESWPSKTMEVEPTLADATRKPGDDSGPPTFLNRVSHWWDASSIYGTDAIVAASLREGKDGKLKVENRGLPTDHATGKALTGFNDNWWLGLAILHTAFLLEHNAICDALKSKYPDWTDDQLYGRARMINSALLAKIHTTEWTPAIVAHPTVKMAMATNWWGLLGAWITKRFGRFTRSEMLSGIPSSGVDHHTAPYALTEEFVSVYRLHPLMPDDLTIRSHKDDRVLKEFEMMDVIAEKANQVVDGNISIEDIFYSFGVCHPGAVTLHNYPKFLQQLTLKDEAGKETLLDVATIDVLRDRERGVPRYNRFRRLLRKKPVKDFDELTDNKAWAEELRRIYDNDIEKVDLMVGMYAEPLPPGFGFSETAFRVFVLMASRRLKSDRFFAGGMTPEVYTKLGIKWLNDTDMRTLLMRHFPSLTPYLKKAKNAFAPWPKG